MWEKQITIKNKRNEFRASCNSVCLNCHSLVVSSRREKIGDSRLGTGPRAVIDSPISFLGPAIPLLRYATNLAMVLIAMTELMRPRVGGSSALLLL